MDLSILFVGFCSMNIFTLQNDVSENHDKFISQSITLFAHGLLDTGENQIMERLGGKVKDINEGMAQTPHQTRKTITSTYNFFDFDDAAKPLFGIKGCKFWHLSIGQDNDVEKLKRAYDQTSEQFPGRSMLGYGVSRGASVFILAAAAGQLPNLKTLVLESPFKSSKESLQSAVEHIPPYINIGSMRINASPARCLAKRIILAAAWKHKENALQPIDVVDKISPEVASLYICSMEDKLNKASEIYDLYEKHRQNGSKDVYILVVEKGKHAKLLDGPNGDQVAYVANAFNKKYGDPYEPYLAEKGESLLRLCQPTGPLAVTQPKQS